LHVDATRLVGGIDLLPGPASAGVDTFYITITGKGGHAAAPHRVVDPIYLAGHVILALHGIVSRRLHPADPAVISIGSIHGGHTDNVIPDHVAMTGTIRFFEPEVQQSIHNELDRALQIARTLGGDYSLRIEIGYPPMHNSPAVVEVFRQVGADLLGAENIFTPRREMGAEDFGFFSQIAPGAMFSLGCQIEGDERKAHSPTFDIDERCLPIGVAMLAGAALRILASPV
jgi:amidohydrolase